MSHGYVFICHTIDTFDTYIQCAVQPVHSYLQYHTIMCNQMTLSCSKTCQLKLSPGCLHLFITHYIICCCDFNCYCLIEIIYLDTRWASVSIRHCTGCSDRGTSEQQVWHLGSWGELAGLASYLSRSRPATLGYLLSKVSILLGCGSSNNCSLWCYETNVSSAD